MRQSEKNKPDSSAIRLTSKKARAIAVSGMALALCLLSLMLFRGIFSLMQALIIPVVLALLTARQPWVYSLAAGVSLLVMTLVFFPTQFVFMITYLLMTVALLKLTVLIHKGSRRHYLLFIPYVIINGLLLYSGLRMTDFVFQTQLHTMMQRLSNDNNLLYAAIMILEAAFISSLHLLVILTVRRRQMRAARQTQE